MENTNTDVIFEKLDNMDPSTVWNDWSLQEKIRLLELYRILSKKESHLFDLIYSMHDCDSWEDIFRDYDREYLNEKTIGIEVALNNLNKWNQN